MKNLIYIAVILLASCAKEDGTCLKKPGERTLLVHDLSSFKNIRLQDEMNVKLIPSNQHLLRLIGSEHILPGIDWMYEGDTLIIVNNNACSWLRKYADKHIIYELYFDTLTHISLREGAQIYSEDTLRGTSLHIEAREHGGSINLLVNVDTLSLGLHTGPTDATVKGKADVAFYYSASEATIDAYELDVRECYVNHSGNNNFFIYARDYMAVQLFGLGDVYYKGSPIIELDDTGGGSLVNGN